MWGPRARYLIIKILRWSLMNNVRVDDVDEGSEGRTDKTM